MNLVETWWREKCAPFEDGIAFGDDQFVELCGTPAQGYRADLRMPLQQLRYSSAEGGTHLDENCSAEVGDYMVHGGSTSAEGAGFIAVELRATGKLAWLLILSGSEPFIEISGVGAGVAAVSEEYPFRWEWRIPLDAPENLTVTRRRFD